MPNWIGDIVMATPVLEELRKNYPHAKITAMCLAHHTPLIKNDPHIDEIYSFHRPSGWIHRIDHTEVIDSLRNGSYDLGILLTNTFSSAWCFWRGRVKQRIGFADRFRSFLLTKAVPFPKNRYKQHIVKTYKELLEPLGILPSDSKPRLYLTEKEIQMAKEQLSKLNISEKNVIIGISPGAAYGTAKCWPPERFKEVARKLLENPLIYVIFFGDPTNVPMINEICKGLPERVLNFAGKTTIRELMAFIKVCSAFMANDSGPMHIAYALNVPVLALFGSTSEKISGPLSTNSRVINKHVECSPCFKRKCPIDFSCMTKIEVEEVYNELMNMIQDANKRP